MSSTINQSSGLSGIKVRTKITVVATYDILQGKFVTHLNQKKGENIRIIFVENIL